MTRVLSARALNRALLARQGLLARAPELFGPLLVAGFYRATWTVSGSDLRIHGFEPARSDPPETADEIERERSELLAFLSRGS